MAQRSFKLPDDLDARLVAEAARLDRPVSWLLVKGAEAALRPDDFDIDGYHEKMEGVRALGDEIMTAAAVPVARPKPAAAPVAPRPNVVLSSFAGGVPKAAAKTKGKR